MVFRRIFSRVLPRAAPLLLAGVGFYAIPVSSQEHCMLPSCNTISAKSAERTFIAIKPDGVQVILFMKSRYDLYHFLERTCWRNFEAF
jgi:hypothetical protein